ncbi:MAG TPA: LysM peptidoglycan-binding domain-containing protein [Longimicrobiaceae bacterium]|nr:LysM peptidoglycan-binding domain-containing protein [Longimicrobiaceae bacterium]
MALAKATITPKGERPIRVLFNPTQYSLDQANTLAEVGVPGLSAPILQYVRGNGRTLSMELFFDTYEERSDVREHTDRIYGLLNIRGPLHRPPVCTFTWGSFSFQCVLERVGGRFTLFLPSGRPVRATLSVSFKEFVEVEVLVRNPPTESADHAKTYVVRRGDTLSSIAAAEYGDPAAWRPIAEANRIANPRLLAPGTRLALPAVT